MSEVLIVLACLGYLTAGVGIGRMLVWRCGFDASDIAIVAPFWAVFAPFALLGAFGYGFYRLIALPPQRVRREQRRDRLAAEVGRLERELGMEP